MSKVLVVDDARDHADLLASLFEAHGHTVCRAYGGRQGLAEAGRFDPEIVFLDLDMPDLDGLAVARSLSCGAAHDRPVLVALTGNVEDGVEARAASAGFDHFLRKPAQHAVLLELCEDLDPDRRGR